MNQLFSLVWFGRGLTCDNGHQVDVSEFIFNRHSERERRFRTLRLQRCVFSLRSIITIEYTLSALTLGPHLVNLVVKSVRESVHH